MRVFSADTVLEKAMHKCVLKPLKSVVSTALQEFQVRSGEWRELKENLALAKARQPQELGVTVTLPPHPMAIEKIRQKFHTMIKLYSPEKKVHMLLKVCRLIYAIMEDNSGVFPQNNMFHITLFLLFVNHNLSSQVVHMVQTTSFQC